MSPCKRVSWSTLRANARCCSESGSTLPLFIGVIFLILLLLFSTLIIAEMAIERSRQQASADLAAMAAANALAKSMEATRVIDGTIWARNVTLDAMYLAAAIVSAGSAGLGAEAFAVPLRFHKATIKPVEGLEKARTGIEKASVVYAVANSARFIQANGRGDAGAAIPFPLTAGDEVMSQRQKDLTTMVAVYEGRIDQAVGKMDQVIREYERKKTELKNAGRSAEEIKADPAARGLLKELKIKSGRVGGLTNWRNRRSGELAKLRGIRPFSVGRDGVVAVVYHPNTPVPFSSALGGLGTGNNIAIAAAGVVDGPPTATIGEEALRRVLADMPFGGQAAAGIDALVDSVNLLGGRARELGKYGPVGAKLHQALDRLGLVPPPLNQVRPTLTSVDEVTGKKISLLSTLKTAVRTAKELEGRLGIDVLPTGIAP